MNKTYKKSDIDKYIDETKGEEINELIDSDGSMIDRNDNYRTSTSVIKSKKTTDDFVRSATQGPEAYFIYGGPYYGINYSYVVNEEESTGDTKTTLMDEEISPESLQDLDAFHSSKKKYSRDERERGRKYAKKDISKHFYKPKPPNYDLEPSEDWANYSLPYDTEFDFDFLSEEKMKSLVDEMFLSKKDDKGIVKKTNEQDLVGDNVEIADIVELKRTFEKPMVIRKLNLLLDLIDKEEINGEELAIILNHLFKNVNITEMSDKHREILGDKIKYGESGE
tara:strand:+ start:2313 stop:3152 length:840 start_codon:yes stop_codon:yes gene_type:complete